jgi:hypothetical protein
MNIVRLLGKKSVLSTLAGCTLGVVGLHRALTPQHVQVSCDPRWAPAIQKELTKKIERISVRTTGIKTLHHELIEEYPCLKDVTISYASNLEATVKLTGWNPLVHVISSVPGQSDALIAQKGHILPKKCFTGSALQGLPVLVIEGDSFEEKLRSPELIEMVVQLPSTLFDDYTVTWHSKTKIVLHSKDKPITITADLPSVHDLDRYTYVQRIYTKEPRYHSGMTADIRLKDSLICAPVHGAPLQKSTST